MIFQAAFWRGASERAIKTFFQTALATLLIAKATLLTGVDWYLIVNTGALAAVISLMTSVGNADFTAGTDVMRHVDRAANGRFTKAKGATK